MCFWNYGLRKTWLDICLESRVLEDPLRGNMINGLKNCCILNDSTIALFSYHFEGN